MNRTRLLFIGFVALALGAVVAFVVYNNLKAGKRDAAAPGADVVIATGDIQVGSKIGDADVKVVHFPAGDLPPTSFRQKSQVVGRGVILPIAKGDFILSNKLAEPNAGSGLPSLIPPGMRAVSVRVNEVVANSGYVQPGTRVDVLLTGNPTGGEQQTTTVLENVAVIAAGQRLERNNAGEPQTSAVITLLVSPDDAQKLTLASSQGRIQLALRNPLDTRQEDLNAVKTGTLYRNASAPVAAAPRVKSKPVVIAVPPPPSVYTVEMIKGDKRDVTKF
jgi:pilus assembly protein CpaB